MYSPFLHHIWTYVLSGLIIALPILYAKRKQPFFIMDLWRLQTAAIQFGHKRHINRKMPALL
jgi:hypothetical protein